MFDHNNKNDNKVIPYDNRQNQYIDSFLDFYKNSNTLTKRVVFKRLLKECSKTELSILSQLLSPLLTVDFFTDLPVEIVRKILSYLDAESLCHCAQVSKRWKELSDDDIVWKDMCERHIGGKCQRCGWGLPLMYNTKRKSNDITIYQNKRIKKNSNQLTNTPSNTSNTNKATNNKHQQNNNQNRSKQNIAHYQRHWKEIYAERLLVERNWRNGKYSTKIFEGHTDSVMCLQIDEARSLMLTGSYDHTIKMWNTDTGKCIRTLEGHSRCVRALQFDENKIISGSMDKTIRIWSLKTGQCIRVMESGHFDGIVTLHFDNRILASGSADHTIKVWNFGSGRGFTLTGHTDWVNKVQIFNKDHLFSCSDDHTIKYWDLKTRQCIRTFEGHSAPVQSLQASITYHQPKISKFDSEKSSKHKSEHSSNSNVNSNDNYSFSDGNNNPHSSKMKGNKESNFSQQNNNENNNYRRNSTTRSNNFSSYSSSSSVSHNSYYFHHHSNSNDLSVSSSGGQENDDFFNYRPNTLQSNQSSSQGMIRPFYQQKMSQNDSNTNSDQKMNIDNNGDSPTPSHKEINYPIENKNDSNDASCDDNGNNNCSTSSKNNWSTFDNYHQNNMYPQNSNLICNNQSENIGKLNQQQFDCNENHHLHEAKGTLVTCSLDNQIKIWDIYTGECKKTLFGHVEGVWCVSFDNMRIVSGAHDQTIKVWDMETGKIEQNFIKHLGPVNCIQLTDTKIISGGDDGKISILDFDLPHPPIKISTLPSTITIENEKMYPSTCGKMYSTNNTKLINNSYNGNDDRNINGIAPIYPMNSTNFNNRNINNMNHPQLQNYNHSNPMMNNINNYPPLNSMNNLQMNMSQRNQQQQQQQQQQQPLSNSMASSYGTGKQGFIKYEMDQHPSNNNMINQNIMNSINNGNGGGNNSGSNNNNSNRNRNQYPQDQYSQNNNHSSTFHNSTPYSNNYISNKRKLPSPNSKYYPNNTINDNNSNNNDNDDQMAHQQQKLVYIKPDPDEYNNSYRNQENFRNKGKFSENEEESRLRVKQLLKQPFEIKTEVPTTSNNKKRKSYQDSHNSNMNSNENASNSSMPISINNTTNNNGNNGNPQVPISLNNMYPSSNSNTSTNNNNYYNNYRSSQDTVSSPPLNDKKKKKMSEDFPLSISSLIINPTSPPLPSQSPTKSNSYSPTLSIKKQTEPTSIIKTSSPK
ncbi:WD40 repeat-like protein [Piromyces finnis]|uniref:WD40 repeat-like protein n=1 Tax=Piromyces finnis TaxID=1754191 RepID=A0A1Y1VK62_9FUNG|nr:WD40 repeat-like protein [Piromyces finnis]|eukprot:ORX58473.1 WD40 repeat-like protein [Piromyces finnis]